MNYPYIGYHVLMNDHVEAIKMLKKDSVGCCQIFISNNRSLKSCTWSDERINFVRDKMKESNITVFIHGPYLLNLSNRSVSNVKICKEVILNQLYIANRIEAVGVVIHMGKGLKSTKEEAINNYILTISEILKDYSGKSKLILETAAGQGTEICSDILELSNMFNRFTMKEKSKLGICIDTCHVFSAGNEIRTPKEALSFYNKAKKLFGDYIKVIHMNDSKNEYNSKKDRHADIGYGEIGVSTLKQLYDLYLDDNIHMILETPTDNLPYIDQIKILETYN